MTPLLLTHFQPRPENTLASFFVSFDHLSTSSNITEEQGLLAVLDIEYVEGPAYTVLTRSNDSETCHISFKSKSVA